MKMQLVLHWTSNVNSYILESQSINIFVLISLIRLLKDI